MSFATRIIIVEDDPEIGPLTRDRLNAEGFDATLAGNGSELDALLARRAPDLIILDLMLPSEDGLSICRRLRARSSVPILMLTARTDEIDRVVGLELGADDYLGKPFAFRELVARIRAVTRRSRGAEAGRATVLSFDGFELHLERMELLQDGVPVPLTSGEFALLRALALHPGRVLSRDQLMDLSQGRLGDGFDRTVDVQISRLRQKLGESPRDPRIIKTVRNGGYIFTGDVKQ